MENKTHLGGECKCDWMRRPDFTTGFESKNRCNKTPPFAVNKILAIFQTPGGSEALLNAFVFAKKLLEAVSCSNRYADPTYYPIVCPLSVEGGRNLRSKAAVTRAMSTFWQGTGSHFFYEPNKATRSARFPGRTLGQHELVVVSVLR